MVKKILAVLLALAAAMSLCSCSGLFADPKSLMSPPKVSGVLDGIEDALYETVKEDFSFVYPTSGEHRSACTICDLTGKNELEAVVFYQLKSSGEYHMNYLSKSNGKWTSNTDIKLVCTAVERLEFADICSSETKEIIIGCDLYNEKDKKLYVYSLDENKSLNLVAQESYTDFSVCNLTGEKKPQLMIFTLGSSTASNAVGSEAPKVKRTAMASLLSFNSEDSSITVVGSTAIDRSITSISAVTEGKSESGAPVLYVDAYKGANLMVTELLQYDASAHQLKNIFYDSATGENLVTKRAVALNSRDINGDGKIEIPFETAAPGYTDEAVGSNDFLPYYSDWKQYNGKGFSETAIGYFNVTDNYFLRVPKTWLNQVTVKIDKKISLLSFCIYDSATKSTGVVLLQLRVFSKHEYDASAEQNKGFTSVAKSGDSVIAAKISGANSPLAVDIDYVKSNLTVY